MRTWRGHDLQQGSPYVTGRMKKCQNFRYLSGAPERIRTSDPQIRSIFLGSYRSFPIARNGPTTTTYRIVFNCYYADLA